MAAHILFQKQLTTWYRQHKRTLPWRSTHNPYKILVSEVMLQQTQVERVKEYYATFIKKFPTIEKLAHASDAEVLKVWSGLGYNRRALNLKKAAQALQGRTFPQTQEELIKLPGIGPYTAGAILAFAFNRDVVFADVNIRRVIERYFGIKTKKVYPKLQELANMPGNAHAWYSALMDFGATICLSRPACDICPLQKSCKAYPAVLQIAQKRVATKPFIGSNRWWRGQILKVLVKEKKSETALYHAIAVTGVRDKRQFLLALAALQEEMLVKRTQSTYHL